MAEVCTIRAFGMERLRGNYSSDASSADRPCQKDTVAALFEYTITLRLLPSLF